MNAPSNDIKNMLESYGESSGFNLALGNNLFIGSEPDKPNDSVTIYDTPGMRPDLGLITQGYERPSVQILVRSTDYMIGWNLAQGIKNALHGRAQQTWGGTLYSLIYCSSGPAFLDWDDKRRVHFSINFNMQRR